MGDPLCYSSSPSTLQVPFKPYDTDSWWCFCLCF
jgi:hypothetical protein